MSNLSFTSKKQNVPVFYFCIRYIEVRMYLAICYPTCFCVAIATLLVPQFLLLPTIICIQTCHVPKSPAAAEMQKSQLWTRITFFWLHIFIPNLTKILIYVYISLPKFAPFLSNLKKSDSLRIPSNNTYFRFRSNIILLL